MSKQYIIYRAGSKQDGPYSEYNNYLEIYQDRTFSDELEVFKILEQLKKEKSWGWRKKELEVQDLN